MYLLPGSGNKQQLTKKEERIRTLVKRTLLVGAIASGVGLATISGAGIANAATSDSPDSLVDKIASTFNLDKSEVQKVFDENREEHQAERQAKLQESLDQAVKDGKLTQDQTDKLLAKLKEQRAEREANRESFKDLSHEERKAEMEANRDEFKDWLEENNISEDILKDIMPERGPGRSHGGPDKGGAL